MPDLRKLLSRLLRLPLLVILYLSAASVSAEQRVKHNGLWLTPQEIAALPAPPPARIASTPTYGTLDVTSYTVGSCDAGNRDSSDGFTAINCGKLQPLLPGPDSVTVGFPVHLPQGSLIDSITMNYYDTHATSNLSVGFYRIGFFGTLDLIITMAAPDFAGGDHAVNFQPGIPPQVDNLDGTYVVLAILDSVSATEYEGIYNFSVHYRLQVSPAPGTATFTDVPTDHPFFRYVEALVDSGITAGCGGGLYCVDAPVTRGQMAVFLSVALGLHFPN